MRQLRSLSLLLVLMGCVITECTGQDKPAPSTQKFQTETGESLFQKANNELSSKLTKIDDAVAKAPSDVQEKIKAIQPLSVAVTVSDQQKHKLLDAAQSFSAESGKSEQWFFRLGVTSIILSAVLALIGSVSSFLKLNRVAGIMSLIVVAIVALSNAFPIGNTVTFYRDQKAGADSIITDCTFTVPYTQTIYDANVAQYKLLVLNSGKRPSFGNFQNPSDTLKAEMQQVKIAANNVESARAETVKSIFMANQPPDKSKTEKYF